MSYNRQPNVVIAGRALKQTPSATPVSPAGIVTLSLEADIATPSSLGVIQVGSGLSITSSGILSATGGGSSLYNVYLTNINYTATANDQFIGCTAQNKTITLPLGVTGKLYIIKNQSEGNVKVQGTSGEKIDDATSITLGKQGSIQLVFDGTRWNSI